MLKADQQIDKPLYIPLLVCDQILNKEFNLKLNSQVTAKPVKITNRINMGGPNIAKVAKVINPLTKGMKKNSLLQQMMESEKNKDE